MRLRLGERQLKMKSSRSLKSWLSLQARCMLRSRNRKRMIEWRIEPASRLLSFHLQPLNIPAQKMGAKDPTFTAFRTVCQARDARRIFHSGEVGRMAVWKWTVTRISHNSFANCIPGRWYSMEAANRNFIQLGILTSN
jgi:hypothetical protein